MTLVLGGRGEEEVLAYAWREDRMLWTHDRDFLDDTRFPEHRNPGIVILPGGSGDQQAMGVGIGTALRVFGFAPTIWKKSMTTITADGEIAIRNRDIATGKITTSRYRMTSRGHAEMWEEE